MEERNSLARGWVMGETGEIEDKTFLAAFDASSTALSSQFWRAEKGATFDR